MLIYPENVQYDCRVQPIVCGFVELARQLVLIVVKSTMNVVDRKMNRNGRHYTSQRIYMYFKTIIFISHSPLRTILLPVYYSF